MTRRIELLVGYTLVLLLHGCVDASKPKSGLAQDTGYARGWVNEGAGGLMTVGRQRLPAPDEIERELEPVLRAYSDLIVGVEWKDGKAVIVSPVEDEWEKLASSTDVGDSSVSRVHVQRVPVSDAKLAFPDVGRLTELESTINDLTAQYQQIALGGSEAETAKAGAAKSLKAVVLQSTAAAAIATDSRQRELLLAMGLNAYQALGTGVMARYESGLSRELQVYRSVLSAATATAIVNEHDSGVGTSFLVHSDWVISCDHVVRFKHQKEAYAVRFDYAAGPDGSIPSPKECLVDEIRSPDASLGLDVVALKLKCQKGFTTSMRKKRALRLTEKEPVWDDAVVVVGHPYGRPAMVADNARVRFPHQVTDEVRTILWKRTQEGRERELFERYYRTCGAGRWCYFSSKDRWSMGQDSNPVIPTLGLDSDTFKGNSGSAVVNAKDGAVIGVLFGSRTNFDVRDKFAFDRHEGAIPASALLEWLRSENIITEK